jgi:hypothetical protein
MKNSYETVIRYKRENKVNFNNPTGTPILSIKQWMEEGRLELQDWFQRDYCWGKEQVVQLVHTLLNTPTLLPEIVLVLDGNEETGKYYVADGHQRLKSILGKVLLDPFFVYKSDEIDDSTDFYGVSQKSKDWQKFENRLLSTSLMVKVIKNNSCDILELNNVKSYVFGKWNNGTGMKEAEKRGGRVSHLNEMVILPLKQMEDDHQKALLKKRILKNNVFNEYVERLFHHYWNEGSIKDPNAKQFKENHQKSLSEYNAKVNQFIKLVKSAGKVSHLFVKENGDFAFDSTCLREMVIFTIGLYQKGDLKNITQYEEYLNSFFNKVHLAYVKNSKFKQNSIDSSNVNQEDHKFWYINFVSTFGSGQDNNFMSRKNFFELNKEVWGNLNTCDKQREFTLQQKQFKYVEQGKRCLGHNQDGCEYTEGILNISEMEGDHILEHSQNGTTTIDNLQMLCKGCHKNKTSKFLLKTV